MTVPSLRPVNLGDMSWGGEIFSRADKVIILSVSQNQRSLGTMCTKTWPTCATRCAENSDGSVANFRYRALMFERLSIILRPTSLPQASFAISIDVIFSAITPFKTILTVTSYFWNKSESICYRRNNVIDFETLCLLFTKMGVESVTYGARMGLHAFRVHTMRVCSKI